MYKFPGWLEMLKDCTGLEVLFLILGTRHVRGTKEIRVYENTDDARRWKLQSWDGDERKESSFELVFEKNYYEYIREVQEKLVVDGKCPLVTLASYVYFHGRERL